MKDLPTENHVGELLTRAREFDEMTRQSQRLRRWIEQIRNANQEWPSAAPASDERQESSQSASPRT
jgi:hypothetical protein